MEKRGEAEDLIQYHMAISNFKGGGRGVMPLPVPHPPKYTPANGVPTPLAPLPLVSLAKRERVW